MRNFITLCGALLCTWWMSVYASELSANARTLRVILLWVTRLKLKRGWTCLTRLYLHFLRYILKLFLRYDILFVSQKLPTNFIYSSKGLNWNLVFFILAITDNGIDWNWFYKSVHLFLFLSISYDEEATVIVLI